MANVLFKKGLYSSLPTQGSNDVVDGALYFAINDTTEGANQRGRLFLGDANHHLIPIGEDIVLKTVATINDLPAANKHAGEFYYIASSNILAFSKDNQWHQVNNDTQLVENQNALTTGAVSSNAISVSLGVKDTSQSASDDPKVYGSFSIKGGNNVTISNDNGAIKIDTKDDDTTYTINSEQTSVVVSGVSRTAAQINLDSSAASGGDSSVKIVSTPSISVTSDTDGIKLAVDPSGFGAVTAVEHGNGAVEDDGSDSDVTTGFHTIVTTSNGSLGANIDPKISIKNAAGQTLTPISFDGGIAALDVYSTSAVQSKIDDLRNTIDAMTYRGGAASQSAIESRIGAAVDANALHNGDVFVATNTFTLPTNQQVEPGYIVIVEGTETNGKIASASDITGYTVVKANDTDTQYAVSGISHGISIDQVNPIGDNEPIGSLTLAEGTAITLSDAGTSAKTVTINHANVRDANYDLTGTAQSQQTGLSKTFNVVTAIETNAQGHVKNITTSALTVLDTVTHLDDGSVTVSVASNTASALIGFTDDQEGEAGATFKVASSSLEITSSATDTIDINLVWGSF